MEKQTKAETREGNRKYRTLELEEGELEDSFNEDGEEGEKLEKVEKLQVEAGEVEKGKMEAEKEFEELEEVNEREEEIKRLVKLELNHEDSLQNPGIPREDPQNPGIRREGLHIGRTEPARTLFVFIEAEMLDDGVYK